MKKTKRKPGEPRRRARFRVMAGLLLTALLLAGLEAAMRVTGRLLQRPANILNLPAPEDEGKLRILALGESTTADYFAQGVNSSWPRQLEALLRQNGIPARVYNEGLGGTQTAFILGRVPELLSTYRPQIVISMMGVNDLPGVVYGDTLFRRAIAGLYQLRLLKLLNWSVAAAGQLFPSCRISNLHYMDFPELVETGFRLSRRMPVEGVEAELRRSTRDEATLAVVLAGVSVRIRGDLAHPAAAVRALPFSERAFALDPRNHWTIFWSLNGGPSADHCRRAVRSLNPCRDVLPDDLLSTMAACFVAYPELSEARLLWAHGVGVNSGKPPATAEHYRLLHRLLRDQGVRHIAMQYPTRPPSDLQAYFQEEPASEHAGITFVSNEFNFLRALKKHPYKEIFSDRFGKTWGHTTPYGHRLIAEALLPVIKRLTAGMKLVAGPTPPEPGRFSF